MTILVAGILLAMAVVMLAGWIFQRAAANGGWTDVFWTYGTGASCAVAALLPVHIQGGAGWRRGLVATLMAVWSLRLGTYVARRVACSPEDVRYALIRRRWGAEFQTRMFWLLIVQAPVTALLGTGVLLAARQPDPLPRLSDASGALILLAAIIGETVADHQMRRFKADRANHGGANHSGVCDRGLWAWSRHPNYFFEILGWAAYPVIAFDPANGWSLLAWGAPAIMFVVIRFGTGIPPLEAAMLDSKGEPYRRYQQAVAPLLPWPPAWRRPGGG